MGASLVYLEEPDKTKHPEDDSSDSLAYGLCSMQGWRLNQVRLFKLRKTHTLLICISTQTHLYSLCSMDMEGMRLLFTAIDTLETN